MMYVRFPLSLRNVADLLAERGIDVCHETVRSWWNRCPLFAGDIRRQRVNRMRGFRQWRWHLDEMYMKLNGEMDYLWRAVDHESEVLGNDMTAIIVTLRFAFQPVAVDTILPKLLPIVQRTRKRP